MDSQIETAATGYVKLSDPVEKQTFDNLIGDRKVLVKRLTTLIQNTYNPYVIGLNSEWGSGKTFFLNAWRNYISTENPKAVCVYFNAWENDCSGDPLANLMAIVKEQIIDPEENLKNHFVQSAQAVVSAGSKLFKWCGPIMAASGNPIGGAVMGAMGKAGEWIINQIKEANDAAKDFRRDLEKFSTEIRSSTNFPLFIMVDELDRCRPDYAIELLERIKHLFNVQNVVFLLAIDGKQLLQQVEHTFGLKPPILIAKENGVYQNNEDSRDTRINYISKFIDIFCQLPEPDKKEFLRLKLKKLPEMKKYCDKFSGLPYLKLGLVEIMTGNYGLYTNKSLRELIQNIEFFSIFLKTNNNLIFEEVFAAFLKIFGNINRMKISQHITSPLLDEYDIYKIFDIPKLAYKQSDFEISMTITRKYNIVDDYSAVNFWICIKMLRQEIKTNTPEFINLFKLINNSIKHNENLPQEFLFDQEIRLRHFLEAERSLSKKLQFLEDFSQTLPPDIKLLQAEFTDIASIKT